MISNKAKILIVDDELLNIHLLFECFKKDYSLLAASNGIDTIKIAKEHRPDLILLDIMLGNTCGFDICSALKQDEATQNIPVIFVSGRGSTEDELKGLSLGAVDYFRKPFSLPLVRMRVQKQIELMQKTARLERLSSLDSLTGLANRRMFDEKLDNSIRYFDRNHRGISLLLIDVDYFKPYNDTYGHLQGDEVLKKVALTLKSGASRPLDFVSRYGGEEFAVLLMDSMYDESLLIAEKLRASIENLDIHHEKSKFGHLTVSVGVTHIDSNYRGSINNNSVIELADQCLYKAKREGRNQVITSHLLIH